jgi:hypothetical protein
MPDAATHAEQTCPSTHLGHFEKFLDSCELEWQKLPGVEHSVVITPLSATAIRMSVQRKTTIDACLTDWSAPGAPNVSYRCVVWCSAGVQHLDEVFKHLDEVFI